MMSFSAEHQPLHLVACVVCKDDRGEGWAERLLRKFSEVYWIKYEKIILMRTDCKIDECLPSEKLHLIEKELSNIELPTFFDVAVVHTGSGDRDRWLETNRTAGKKLVFNAVGKPTHQGDEIPVYRSTAPEIRIDVGDIVQLAEFITGLRIEVPDMCKLPLSPMLIQVLPALAILCQGYLAVFAEFCQKDEGSTPVAEIVTSALNRMGWPSLDKRLLPKALSEKMEDVSSPLWWQSAFRCGDKDHLDLELAEKEWRELTTDEFSSSVADLIQVVSSESGKISAELVANVYCDLAVSLEKAL